MQMQVFERVKSIEALGFYVSEDSNRCCAMSLCSLMDGYQLLTRSCFLLPLRWRQYVLLRYW